MEVIKLAINVYSDPFTTKSPVTSHTTANSCTCSYLDTPMVFPDGKPVQYAVVAGRCDGSTIQSVIEGKDAVLKVIGYLCVSGTCCIYTIRTDDAGYGKFCYGTGNNNDKYTICSPGGNVYYHYMVWYLDK